MGEENNMNIDEYNFLMKSDARNRYEYFIKKVTDFEEVWGLYDIGWVTTTDSYGRTLIPFWPKKEFAEGCALQEWQSCVAISIELDEFINEWLPGMRVDGILPSIFWNNDDSAVVEVNVILSDLEEELENY